MKRKEPIKGITSCERCRHLRIIEGVYECNSDECSSTSRRVCPVGEAG